MPNLSPYFIYIPLAALLIAILAYFLNRKVFNKTLSNKFIEKQIEAVGSLVNILNSTILEITFTIFQKDGSTGGVYHANVFELEFLKIIETNPEFYDNPIGFAKNSNQIFDFKPFLNNSYLPQKISVELEKFYSRHSSKISSTELIGNKMVVIRSNYYESNIWDKSIVEGFTIWEPHVFAFLNFGNLIECSVLLKTSIINWLKEKNIQGININVHMAH
jgi:hypothetical protein